jgi:hypothetical protein
MKKMKTLCIGLGMMAAHFANAQANTSLGNLTSPTSVNQSLIPSTDATKNLGSLAKSWDSLYVKDGIRLNSLTFQNGVNFTMCSNPLSIGGIRSTIIGSEAGQSLSSASECTFIGSRAGENQTSGLYNTFIGARAGEGNSSGGSNTIVGAWSGIFNSSGADNIFMGVFSGYNNSTGSKNNAIGNSALNENTIGINNVAFGHHSCRDNITGSENTAIGYAAMDNNDSGSSNVALGANALGSATSANSNVVIGADAATYIDAATGIVSVGYKSAQYLLTGSNNTFLGNYSGVTTTAGTVNNSTVIGYQAIAPISNMMSFGNTDAQRWMFGRTSMTASRALQVGTTTSNGNGASLTTGGTWTNASSRSLKSDLQNLDAQDVLKKVNKLELTRWKYNETNEYHIGPMAEQFYEFFNVGVDNVSVSTIDPAGVALVSIQALSQNQEALAAELSTVQNENQSLKEELAEMKECIAKMCELELKLSQITNESLVSMSILSIMPNPSNQSAFIGCFIPEKTSKAALLITDTQGKVVSENTISVRGSQKIEVNTSMLNAGTYACVLMIDNSPVASTLMMIAH